MIVQLFFFEIELLLTLNIICSFVNMFVEYIDDRGLRNIQNQLSGKVEELNPQLRKRNTDLLY